MYCKPKCQILCTVKILHLLLIVTSNRKSEHILAVTCTNHFIALTLSKKSK